MPRRAIAAAALAAALLAGTTGAAEAATRTVVHLPAYSGGLHQLGLGAGGVLSPLSPLQVPGSDAAAGVSALASPDGRFLTTSTNAGALRTYTVRPDGTLELLQELPTTATTSVFDFEQSADGTSLWASFVETSAGSAVLGFRRAADGRLSASATTVPSPSGRVQGIALSPDGTKLAVADRSAGSLEGFDVSGPGRAPSLLKSTLGYGPVDVDWIPDDNGGLAITDGAASGKLHTYDWPGGSSLTNPRTFDSGGQTFGLAVAPGGHRAYVSNYIDGTVRGFQLDGAAPGPLGSAVKIGGATNMVALSPDASTLVVGTEPHPTTKEQGPGVGTALVQPDGSLAAGPSAAALGIFGSYGVSVSTAPRDTTAPAVTISEPADGTRVVQGAALRTAYACVDEPHGSGLATCSAPTASGQDLPTDVVGPRSFAVQGTDGDGNATTSTVTYVVDPAPEPVQGPKAELGSTGVSGRPVGKVRIKLPGARSFVLVGAEPIEVPVASVLDLTSGRLPLTFATPGGGTQTMTFYGGVAKVAQQVASTGEVTLTLQSDFADCPRTGPATAKARAAAAKKRRGGRLWGDGHGRFRTKGRYGAAAVRGTKYLVEDTCTSTDVRVERGVVQVQDLVRGTKRLLKAPGSTSVRGARKRR